MPAMRPSFLHRLALLASLSSFACGVDRSGEEPSKQPKDPVKTEAPIEAVNEAPIEPLPEHMADQVVTISAALARSKGLAPLGFSLDFTGTAFTVSPFAEGSYLYASGPPGGPLGLRVSPVARNAEFAGVVGGSNPELQLIAEQVELLGASRRAVTWISGSSMARTSWCAVIVEPAAGDDALLLELGVGHSGDEVSCKIALGHDELAKVVASLRFE